MKVIDKIFKPSQKQCLLESKNKYNINKQKK